MSGRAGRFNEGLRLSKPPVIAIVDDDEPVREALHDLLQVEGLSARTFESGVAFLADDELGRFDCLVTDVRMPEIDGVELQEHLRARGLSMPVIFITSSSNEATRTRAMQGGATAWLAKPVVDEALLAALREALGKPQVPNA
jgi:FixJ family two-component response regulator